MHHENLIKRPSNLEGRRLQKKRIGIAVFDGFQLLSSFQINFIQLDTFYTTLQKELDRRNPAISEEVHRRYFCAITLYK